MADLKERPILFNGPMVRAILEGRKTQTRRVVKEPGWATPHTLELFNGKPIAQDPFKGDRDVLCPYGQPGDRLWVRETWAAPHRYDHVGPSNIPVIGVRVHYAATEDRGGLLWRPSIHMPRWASRITLEVTGVRVERLQDISRLDCLAEGWAPDERQHKGVEQGEDYIDDAAIEWYADLWESINGPGSWDANPWVWVVEFRRINNG